MLVKASNWVIGTQAAYDTVRKTNAFIAYDKDIEMFKELEKITDVVKRGDILEAVEIRQTSSSSDPYFEPELSVTQEQRTLGGCSCS